MSPLDDLRHRDDRTTPIVRMVPTKEVKRILYGGVGEALTCWTLPMMAMIQPGVPLATVRALANRITDSGDAGLAHRLLDLADQVAAGPVSDWDQLNVTTADRALFGSWAALCATRSPLLDPFRVALLDLTSDLTACVVHARRARDLLVDVQLFLHDAYDDLAVPLERYTGRTD